MKARLLGKRPLSFPLRMNLQGDFIHCLPHFINHFSNRVHQLLDKTSHLNASDVFRGLHENQSRNGPTIQISYPSDPTLSVLRNHSGNYFLSSLCWAKQRPHQSTKLQSFCLFKGGFFFFFFFSAFPKQQSIKRLSLRWWVIAVRSPVWAHRRSALGSSRF